MDLQDDKFNPNKESVRLEIVKALGRLEGINLDKYRGKSLSDISENSDESAYVNWAIEKGIIAGYEDGTFRDGRDITREEMAKILYTYVKATNKNFNKVPTISFNDGEKISDWAKDYVKNAQELGLVAGRTDGSFDPQASISRAEVAQILSNLQK